MENLVTVFDNGKVVVSSITVAEKFGKNHFDVLRSLTAKLRSANKDRLSQHFFKSTYKDESGKKNTMYLMDRDGFCFLVMGFTGEKADKWKLDFIDAFDEMEQEINSRNDIALIEWQSKYNELENKLQETQKNRRQWVLKGARDNVILGYLQSTMTLKGSIVQDDFDTIMNFVKDNIIQLQDKIERENGNL